MFAPRKEAMVKRWSLAFQDVFQLEALYLLSSSIGLGEAGCLPLRKSALVQEELKC